MTNYQQNISEKTLVGLADMFGEGENIAGVPNDADLEMDEFRKLWQRGGSCTGYDGYMIYSSADPVRGAARANRLIKEFSLRLFAEPSNVRAQFTVEYLKK